MMGTVGLELTNFINPELTWKTVAKGNRSASRRSRKPASRNSKMGAGQADRSPKKTENGSVSESEKLGVAVLGRRFSDKVEHVPIKKRRFMFQSPSPPPRTPSPPHEDSEQLVDSQHSSSQQSSSNSISKQQIMATHASKFIHSVDVVVDGRISEVTNEEIGNGEDFSGIEMLAAAACNNSMGDDVTESTTEDGPVLTCEANNSSISAMPIKETVASPATANTFQKDVAIEDDIEGSFSQDNSVAVLQNLHSDKDDGALKRSASSRDDRLHWDLNVVMDAWEQPDDYQVVDSQTNISAVSEDGKQQSEKLDNLEDCQIPNSGDIKTNIETTAKSMTDTVVLGDVEGDINMASDSRCEGLRTCDSNTEEHKLEACSTANTTCSHEKGIPTPTEHALESTVVAVSDAKASEEVIMDACLMQPASPRSRHIGNAQISDENRNTAISGVIVDQSREDCISDVQLDKPVCLESVEVEKNEVGFSPPPVTKTNCEIDCLTNKDDDNSRQISSGEMMSTDICSLGPEHAEVPTNESGEVHVPHSSPRCDDVSASGASAIEGQSVVTVGVKEHNDQVSADDATEVDPSVHVGARELVNKSSEHSTISGEQSEFIPDEVGKNCDDDPANCSGKVDLEDPFDDSYDTDVSQDDRGHPVGMENVTELDAGYDSQIEDGELRESVVHAWEENDAEDGEAERVDYESDNRDMYDFDAVDYPGPMTGEVEVGSECEKERLLGPNHHFGCGETTINNGVKGISDQSCLGGSLANEAEFSNGGLVKTSKPQSWTQFTRKVDTNIKRGSSTGTNDVAEEVEQPAGGGALKEQSQTNVAQYDQLPNDREISTDKNVEVNDGRAIGPRSTRRELLSRIEGPSYDILRRKDAVILQRSRSNNLDDSDPRAERGTDSDKSMGRSRSALHIHGRGQRDGNWDQPSTGYWDSKRRHSPSYHAPYGSGRPRPRSIVETGGFVMTSDRTISKAGVGGLNGIHRQSMNSSSKGVYRPLIRRRSPSDRDDAYGMHMGMAPGRDVSPERSRGRSRRYQGVHRGPRENYHGSIPDETAEFPLRVPHHLARRERSISPIFNRGAPHFSETHKISQSRSRSRSPPAWLMSRERNASSRHFSRSPDFRSGARMERMRLPFQKPNFADDYEEGFLSPPRGRISPQHNSRWIDDRNGAMDHFRDGRSPVRMFQQSQRFDSMGPPRRLKSNDYYRPMIHPGRLPEMVGAGRGRKHDDSDDDRRKHGDRYEMIRPVRRYDTGGVVKRFRYDTEDCVLSRNPHNNDDCIRGTDRRPRDIPRRPSEEKRHLRYNHERLYNSSPNSFGMREYDEDVSPRRGRPA